MEVDANVVAVAQSQQQPQLEQQQQQEEQQQRQQVQQSMQVVSSSESPTETGHAAAPSAVAATVKVEAADAAITGAAATTATDSPSPSHVVPKSTSDDDEMDATTNSNGHSNGSANGDQIVAEEHVSPSKKRRLHDAGVIKAEVKDETVDAQATKPATKAKEETVLDPEAIKQQLLSAASLAERLAMFEPVRKRHLVRPATDGVMDRFSDALGDAILIEFQSNGGSSVVHVFPDVLPNLNKEQQAAFAHICYEVIFAEDDLGDAYHVFGIIHDGTSNIPNVLRYIASNFPKTPIVRKVFGQTRLTQSMSIEKFVDIADKTLEFNTHRAGTMDAMTLVGCQKAEETGGYFEDVLKLLDGNHWLKEVLPWGSASRYDDLNPAESDDGPIMWACPGEQVVPLVELAAIEKGHSGSTGNDNTPTKRKRTDIDRLALLPRNERPREKLVEDRTGAHADMAGLFPDRHPVAAVGFVQGMTTEARYDLKDIIAFQACDMYKVADLCGLYFQEEPKDQLVDKDFWVDEAKLNHLRRNGVRYAHIRLKADDIYFIPRKVVHQFKTVSACISITWHLKHRSYYKHLQLGPAVSRAFGESSFGSEAPKAKKSGGGMMMGGMMSMGSSRSPSAVKKPSATATATAMASTTTSSAASTDKKPSTPRKRASVGKAPRKGPSTAPSGTKKPSSSSSLVKSKSPSSSSSSSKPAKPSVKKSSSHRRSSSSSSSDSDSSSSESDSDGSSSDSDSDSGTCSTCGGSSSDSGSDSESEEETKRTSKKHGRSSSNKKANNSRGRK